ncbi:hypothetical protein FD723_39900 (plasmid) [Nostoc sp. C052]|uniref:hypothetical protein n=1 Tax=Nostoc sp. C052 TaxID=2576902 RepID=UPI0015C3CACA|nr:hypothetical protein [Nostoc sp. C052]QLE46377.1 hypothetical protein FD723_39900 [Nostoc sp. C052]
MTISVSSLNESSELLEEALGIINQALESSPTDDATFQTLNSKIDNLFPKNSSGEVDEAVTQGVEKIQGILKSAIQRAHSATPASIVSPTAR